MLISFLFKNWDRVILIALCCYLGLALLASKSYVEICESSLNAQVASLNIQNAMIKAQAEEEHKAFEKTKKAQEAALKYRDEKYAEIMKQSNEPMPKKCDDLFNWMLSKRN